MCGLELVFWSLWTTNECRIIKRNPNRNWHPPEYGKERRHELTEIHRYYGNWNRQNPEAFTTEVNRQMCGFRAAFNEKNFLGSEMLIGRSWLFIASVK